MRHRGGTGPSKTVVKGVTGTLSKLTELLSEEETATGRHKQANGQPLIPQQLVPTHETIAATEPPQIEVTDAPEAPEVEVAATVETVAETTTDIVTETATEELAPQVAPVVRPPFLPAHAQWKSSHGPRAFSALLLLLAVGGTSALGLRYAEDRGSNEFLSVIAGIAVVVGLWALLIASTPQVVSLRGRC